MLALRFCLVVFVWFRRRCLNLRGVDYVELGICVFDVRYMDCGGVVWCDSFGLVSMFCDVSD